MHKIIKCLLESPSQSNPTQECQRPGPVSTPAAAAATTLPDDPLLDDPLSAPAVGPHLNADRLEKRGRTADVVGRPAANGVGAAVAGSGGRFTLSEGISSGKSAAILIVC